MFRYLVVSVAIFLLPLGNNFAEGQCYKAAVVITSGVSTKKPKTAKLAVGAVVYRLRSGAVSIVEGSTVGYIAGRGKTVLVQSSGAADGLFVDGDITSSFKQVVVSGVISYPVPGRGNVSALLKISAVNLRFQTIKRGNKTIKKLTGRTAVEIIDLSNGAVLYKQLPKKFSKSRSIRYQWEQESCFGGPGQGPKR